MKEKINPKGLKLVGIDEVGRGPLAGPVFAVACFLKKDKSILLKESFWRNIKDSKKYSQKKREEVFEEVIKSGVVEWGLGVVFEKEIDKINILEATKLAMQKALYKIDYKDALIIIDGNFKINSDCLQKPIIKADESVLECSLASIIAKVKRDRVMGEYHKKYPQYGFDKNKGYGTAEHVSAIKKYGFCSIHRKSFKIKTLLE